MAVIKIIAFAAAFILFISIFQFFLSIHPPRFRDAHTPEDFDLDYENVSFETSDGITIRGWLISSDDAKGTAIVSHGYPFDKANVLPAMLFLHPDYNLLFYDHRSFGESDGRITTVGLREVKDVRAAVDFAKNRFGDAPLALFGFSLSASSMLMADADVDVIIADSPYADLGRMVKHSYWIFGPLKFPFVWMTNLFCKTVFGVWPKDVSAADAIKDTKIPILVIHGDADSQIPVENSYALKEKNPSIELWIVKGAEHGQAVARSEYKKRVREFLRTHMER